MGTLRVAGVICALLSCLPAWHGLQAIAESDYFGATLALGLTWILARTGIELVAMSGATSAEPAVANHRADGDMGA